MALQTFVCYNVCEPFLSLTRFSQSRATDRRRVKRTRRGRRTHTHTRIYTQTHTIGNEIRENEKKKKKNRKEENKIKTKTNKLTIREAGGSEEGERENQCCREG